MTIDDYNRLIPHSMGYDELRGTFRCSSCLREIYLLDTGIEVVAVGKTVSLDGILAPVAYPHTGSRGGVIIGPVGVSCVD